MTSTKPSSEKMTISTEGQASYQSSDNARVVKERKFSRQASYNYQERGNNNESDMLQSDSQSSSLQRPSICEYEIDKQKQLKTNSQIDLIGSTKDDSIEVLSYSDNDNLKFYHNYLEFLGYVKDVPKEKIKFEYMKDQYLLEIQQFPLDDEAHQIQQAIIKSTQINSKKLKKNWNEEERSVLIWVVGKYCAWQSKEFKNIVFKPIKLQKNDQDWEYLGTLMNRRDGFSCKQKWLSMLKQQLFQAPWTKKEDENLREIYDLYLTQNKQNKWSTISDELNRRMQQNIHRTGKQCRERWNNHLNPDLNRHPWSDEEDLNLLQLIHSIGKKWAQISKSLTHQRNENSVKNRYNCLIKKEVIKKMFKFNKELYLSSMDNDEIEANFQEKDENQLSAQDLNAINSAIQKLQWRMNQRKDIQLDFNSSNASSPIREKLENINKLAPGVKVEETRESLVRIQNSKRASLDHMILEEHFRGLSSLQQKLQGLSYTNLPYYLEIESEGTSKQTLTFQFNQPSIDNLGQSFTFYQDQLINATHEDFANCQPCLVNTKKETIYFLSSQQMIDYLQNYQQRTYNHFQPISTLDDLQGTLILQNMIKSQDKILFKTLNTIDEYSNPGSKASIGQYLNTIDYSQRRYNEEMNNQDRQQQIQQRLCFKDSLQNIESNKSDQRIFSNQNIGTHNQVTHNMQIKLWNPNQVQIPQIQQTQLQMQNLINFNMLMQKNISPDFQQFPYQFLQNNPQSFFPNIADPFNQFNTQIQSQNLFNNFNVSTESPQSISHAQE